MRTSAVVALLREYLQHQGACSLFRCVQCGRVREHDLHYSGTPDSHAFVAFPCDCGLDEAMKQLGLGLQPARRP